MNISRMALLALLAQGPAAQPPPANPATIEGVVVKLGTREPVSGARVQLELERDPSRNAQSSPGLGGGAPPLPENHFGATTGPDGKFVIENLPPGEYRLYAYRSGGYVPAEYGQRSSRGRGISFELAPGQKMTDLQLALTPTGSISGRVYDRDGEPAGRAVVQALRPFYRDGTRALTIVQSVFTNDRGEYRLFWLPPGQYYVTAKSSYAQTAVGDSTRAGALGSGLRITEPARFVTFEQASAPVVRSRTLPTGEAIEEIQVPVYYPGTTEVTAAAGIDLRSGGSADGVDISVTAGSVRTHHIRGLVTDGTTGLPSAQASVLAVPRTFDPSAVIPTDRSGADGSFDIAGVAPGVYFLFANDRGRTGGVALQMSDANVDNVAVAVTGGFRLFGRIIVDGLSRNGSDLDVTGLRVTLRRDPDILGMPNGGPSFNPPPTADGSFVLDGVPFGDYRVTFGRPGPFPSLPNDAYVKSMRMGSADVLEGGLHLSGQPRDLLEIVIGADGGQLNGTVANTRREPLPNSTVVLVADAGFRNERYKVVASDGSGRFRIQGLTPGDYKVFAWEDIEEGAWQDPDVIRSFESRGTSVRIREGRNETVQVTGIPGR